jgi:hypothetical protein
MRVTNARVSVVICLVLATVFGLMPVSDEDDSGLSDEVDCGSAWFGADALTSFGRDECNKAGILRNKILSFGFIGVAGLITVVALVRKGRANYAAQATAAWPGQPPPPAWPSTAPPQYPAPPPQYPAQYPAPQPTAPTPHPAPWPPSPGPADVGPPPVAPPRPPGPPGPPGR